jgi:hypothetical protein
LVGPLCIGGLVSTGLSRTVGPTIIPDRPRMSTALVTVLDRQGLRRVIAVVKFNKCFGLQHSRVGRCGLGSLEG